MQRLPLRTAWGWLLLASLAWLSCQDTSGPGGSLGIRVVRGGGETDTVLARLTQALVVEVRDSLGHPARGETVRFEAVPADSPAFVVSLFVAGLADASYGTLVVDSANIDGEAAALVQLGFVAGPGRVRVFVPRLGLVDTVGYTILAGAPALVLALPKDTAVAIGASYAMRATVRDAYGNPRSDPVTYSGGNSAATVSALGSVAGQAAGRATILATAGTRTDTARVTVVPSGTIAATVYGKPGILDGSIVTLRLDGSSMQAIPQSNGDNQYLSWMPSGTAVLHFVPSFDGHVNVIDLAGNRTLVVPAGTFVEDNWPSVSSDGAWVYFRVSAGGPSDIYRIHPNGTGLERLPTALSGNVTQPWPSPDGLHIAYAGSGTGGVEVRVYNVSTGADSLVAASGFAPHWSPTGAWIAFNDNGAIMLVHPDGTGTRRASSPTFYYDWTMSWSPDERWLVVSRGGVLDLIEVATGLTLPLPFTFGMAQPAWKP